MTISRWHLRRVRHAYVSLPPSRHYQFYLLGDTYACMRVLLGVVTSRSIHTARTCVSLIYITTTTTLVTIIPDTRTRYSTSTLLGYFVHSISSLIIVPLNEYTICTCYPMGYRCTWLFIMHGAIGERDTYVVISIYIYDRFCHVYIYIFV
jgi:hypothetical protein